jgi:hypothetical protein
MAAATIDLKIKTAYKESEALYKKEATWQQKVDNLLDRMNALNKALISLHSVLLKLSFEIERDMEGFKKSRLAPSSIKKVVAISVKILNKIHRSDLYPGVKTTYYTLKQEISYLNELVNDRKVSLELEEDDEMKSIIESTLSAAKRK